MKAIRIALIALMALLVSAPIYAADWNAKLEEMENTIGRPVKAENSASRASNGSVEAEENPFKELFSAFDSIFRSAAMAMIMAAIFMWRLVAAYIRTDTDPHAPKRALMEFLVAVVAIAIVPEFIFAFFEGTLL